MAEQTKIQQILDRGANALTRGQRYALAVWLVLLLCTPSIIEWAELLPPDTGFIPRILILFALPAIFLQKLSFRVGMVLVLATALFSLFTPPALRTVIDGLNYRMEDAFFHIRGPRKPSGQVVIVDIDQKSLHEIGQWPWPRSYISALLQSLKDAGARCVGFDIVFAEPDRQSLGAWVQRLDYLGHSINISDDEVVDPVHIRRLVLEEWLRRLQDSDPTFQIDPALSPEEKAQLIEAEYLKEQQANWEEAQQTLAARFAAAGLPFSPIPFAVPESTYTEMLKQSREAYYLHRKIGPQGWAYSLLIDNDKALGAAMHDPRVVAGGLFITRQSAGSKIEGYQKKEARRETRGMTISSGIINVEEVFPGLRQAIEQIPNVAAIQEQLYHQGTFNIVPDSSGAARFYTVMMQAPVFQESLVLKPGLEGASGMALLDPDNYETKIVAQYFTYPSIALEMIRAANGYDVVEPGYQDETRGLFLRRDKGFVYQEQQVEYTKEAFSNLLPQEIFIPVDFKGDMPIDFLGYGGAWQPEFAYEPEYYFNYVSLSDALNKRFPEGTFKDKYVLIGSTDPTLSDLVGSPFRAAFPGLEVHAVVLDNLIQGRFLTDHGKWATLYQFLGILVIGTLIALAISYFESWAAGLGALIVLVGVPTLSYYGLAYDGIIINFVYPWLATVLLTGTIVIINFFVEGRDRRFVTTQFSKMVSGDVLKKLKDDPAGVSLKGQRSSVTVMFSDIAGFTSIAETMPPQDLVQVLNDYFTPMTDIIMKHDGFIDKFMGDAIMSCWGVPFPDDNHALKACMATLEQQKALQELAPRIKERYGIDISVRMGMASGEVSAAMMGSENRKSYTVMGDVVNFGSRLEPCCKDYKVPILIDEETKTQVADAVVTRCVDKIVVKGKTIPVPIYQLVGLKGEVAEADLERLRRFEEALHLHWERQWDAAEAILNDYPKDGPSQTLLKRIAQYRLEPPPPKWQGEFVKTSKK